MVMIQYVKQHEQQLTVNESSSYQITFTECFVTVFHMDGHPGGQVNDFRCKENVNEWCQIKFPAQAFLVYCKHLIVYGLILKLVETTCKNKSDNQQRNG